MQTRRLLILTTRLPPQVCGVGTFSWLLHQAWPENGGSQEFVVVDGAESSHQMLQSTRIAEFRGDWKTLGKLLSSNDSTDLLLHYTGRGYHWLGCPVGLAKVLKQWKAK